jgi:Fe(3+) dicitrate transport protein
MNGFDNRGLDVWNREFTADAFSAFLQSDIVVSDRLNVVPGLRLENYHISRKTNVLTVDDEEEACPPALGGEEEECVFYEGYQDKPFTESYTRTHVLPGAAFAYGFGGTDLPVNYGSKSLSNTPIKPTHTSTVYGGYHRGLTMNVLREVAFPVGNELGDNYQIGLRSVAVKGLTFDIAGFHQNIQDYQFASEVTLAGDRTFDSVDEVHVNGFEVYGRLDTRPYTGWTLNPYTEASFTLADSKVARGFVLGGDDDDEEPEEVSVAGKYIPEVPREYAYLTAGIESTAGWNASVSWIYRGAFYTDIFNTPFGGDPEGEAGLVPSVWLLAARANYTIPNTNAVIFISGQNLTDEVYITDREDGVKPGIGRTIMLGGKYKW